ncbi:MAG: carboxypeptidase regulatory-like domain-containing protein [Bryobacterales bacterium]|nr:carboxypeptidase regulatory-like domain-containing protein [Bryobacterales bacterium]
MVPNNRLLVLATAMILAGAVCFAQVERGGITGSVTDSTGASMAKVSVTAVNEATGVVSRVETTDDGLYKIPYLPAGTYTLTMESDGFTTHKVASVPVLVGQVATVNATLKPGSLQQEITVRADALSVEQASSSLGYVTSGKQIIELPTGRSPYSLLKLSPGVIDVGNAGTGPIVSGGRSNTSAILFDGQDTRNNSTLDNAYTPPQESVAEVRYITNSFSAEYGRSAGGVVVAAGRSGTNQLHGSAYDYLRNDKLNANSWANNRNNVARGRQRRNDYGFSLSGPVYLPKLYDGRNKTFFFFNWDESNDHGVSTPTANVPTALQKTGDFSQTMTSAGALIRIYDPLTTMADSSQSSGFSRQPFPGNLLPASRMDPAMKKVLAYYPEPTLPNSPTVNVNWSQNFPQIVKTTRWYGRGDRNFSDRNKLFFRYGYETTPRTSPFSNIAFPGEGTNGGGNQSSIGHSAALSDTHTFSPNLIGEFRAGFTRREIKLTPLSVGFDFTTLGFPQYMKAASGATRFPRFNITDFTALGPDRASHNITAETTPQYQAHITWLKGAHAVKTGFDLLICYFNTFRPDYPAGLFGFGRAFTQGPNPATATATAGYGLASAMLGVPDSGQFTVGPSLALVQPSNNFYLQDDWKVRRDLTINLGLRFEYQTPFRERYNQIAYFDPSGTEPLTGQKGVLTMTSASHRYPSNPNYNWAPRIGLAWTFRPATVFRAGYGIFFAPGSGGVGSSPGDLGSGSSVSTGVFFGQPPAAPNTPVPGASLANPFVTGLRPYPNSLVGGGVNAIWPEWPTPTNQMWNANLQRTFGSNLLVEAAYIGSRGMRIWNNYNRNATYPASLSRGSQLNALVPNPFFGQITIGTMSTATVRQGILLVPYPHYAGNVGQLRASVGDSVYHGFTLRAERSFANGLMFQVSFTGAKLIDNVNERFLGGANFINPYDLNMSRSLSAADINRRLVANWVYELPFGHGKQFLSRGIGGKILGNWQVSGILTTQTGTPLSISAACTMPGVSGLGCYADRLKDARLPDGAQTMDRWFDTAAYANPGPYSFGNGSRTEPNLRNPGTFGFDTVLSRWQPIRERARLQFRAEFYNMLNHPNLGAPSTGITSSTYGMITTKTGNRTMVMGLRLEF